MRRTTAPQAAPPTRPPSTRGGSAPSGGQVNPPAGAVPWGETAPKYGPAGLADDTISINLTGTGGQRFGAFLARGLSLTLTGDGNDYVGKGLSGGRVVVRQPPASSSDPADNNLVGNTGRDGRVAGEAE